MSRLRRSFAQTTAQTTGAKRRPATLAAVALLIIVCPLAVAACGGTKVSVSTPKNTPEISTPAATVSKESTTKSHSASSSGASATTGEPEAGASETTEAPETGGTEATEEPTTGGEVAPEETEPAEATTTVGEPEVELEKSVSANPALIGANSPTGLRSSPIRSTSSDSGTAAPSISRW